MWPRRNAAQGQSFYDSSTVPSSSVSEAEDGGRRNTSHLHRDTTGTSVGDSSFLSSASDMSDSEGLGLRRDATLRRRNREDMAMISDLPPAESPIVEEPQTHISSSEIPKSDHDSDSTIGTLKAVEADGAGLESEALSPPDTSATVGFITSRPS